MARRPQIVSCLLLLTGLAATAAHAVVARQESRSSLADRSFVAAHTAVVADAESLATARPIVGQALNQEWERFRVAVGEQWVADVDKRSGRITYAEGAGIPWVPGRGNDLSPRSIVGLSRTGTVDLATLEGRARAFLPRVEGILGLEGAELKLNESRSGQQSAYVWFVDFDVVRGGMPVEGARVVFRVNNGNLIQFGTENLPAPGARLPKLEVQRAAARQALADYLGGFQPTDRWVDRGSLHLLPVNVADGAAADGYRMGAGRGLALVWEFTFRREGEVGTWRGKVDASTGEVIEFFDANEYGVVTGGTYRSDRPATEVVLPMPFANVASGVYANSAGVFSGTTGTTSLVGQYIGITDRCGAISKAADGTGAIALGSSAGTDCTTPGTGGAGNTHAARTQYYMLNRAKEAARGWLPTNSWVNARLTSTVNIQDTCNAYWSGSTVNFFRSGGGCANTGELPGVSLHEYGHGMDSNDGSGSSPDNGTGETYGDVTAALATHGSCIGNGFLGTTNCGGYGNSCTGCSGVRDIDWARHSRNTPSTVANFTQTTCPQPSANNPNYIGPCGKDAVARSQTTKKREGHCESLVSSEAVWDLAARDLPNPNTGAAWAVLDRLWYLSRSTATAAFTCNVSGTTWTSSGCSTGSLFRTFRAVDDDNGNLADGTPNGGAIAAAFNRHGIACTTDAGWNTTFRAVAQPAVPALTVTAGNNTANLSWSGSTGVYDIYRNEAGCNAGFTKIANDRTGTTYADTAVANGFTYYYQIVAQPSGNEAAASAPSTCRTVTPAAAPCTPPAAPTGVTATAASASQINLSWAASSGATSYTILRATTSGGPYSSVGTSATTSFSNTGLSCNTTYYYVVQASNGTCSSGNSAQAQAVTSICTGNVLTNGVPVSSVAGATGSSQFWTLSVPAGATNLRFTTSGGTGDADLYARFGSQPTTTTNDCKSESGTNTETCTITTAQAGTYHVLVYGYAAYSGLTLTGSYNAPCTPPSAPTGVSATAASASQINLAWGASAGATSYTVSRSTTSGGPYSSVGTSATTSFANTGLTCNTTYHYVVTASNGTCGSSNSTQVSATTSACTGGTELIVNGGFETTLTPWVASNAFRSTTAGQAKTGVGYAYLGNANSITSTLYQQIAIPAAATGTLTFWFNATSAETTTSTKYDNFYVEVRNTSGSLLATLGQFSNLDKTATVVYSLKTFNVAAYRGQTVRIQFRSTTDSSLITTFRVDDISVK
jgi:fibronectin type 3 domain-containing protein